MKSLPSMVIIDENISNHGYIGTLILLIHQRIFWKKKFSSLKLIKNYENIEKNSKNNIINNNRYFKVIL